MKRSQMTPVRPFILFTALALAAISVTGCSGAKRALGIEKVAPDEFTVVTKAPLVVPPDYSLRPPQPGRGSPVYVEPGGRAQQALFGRNGTEVAGSGFTGGEATLLQITGGAKADPNIRQIIDMETASLIEKSESLTDQIIFWQDQPQPGQTIDAVGESQRLRENAAAGKPANEGDVPVNENRKKAPLEDLF